MKDIQPMTRRDAVKTAAATSAAFFILPGSVLGGAGPTAPGDKLNIAGIGIGGMGAGDMRSVAGENIVALCDVDEHALARNAKTFPKAKLYSDFRKMLETQKEIDAVVIATPDHTHAVASIMAMKMGKHVRPITSARPRLPMRRRRRRRLLDGRSRPAANGLRLRFNGGMGA